MSATRGQLYYKRDPYGCSYFIRTQISQSSIYLTLSKMSKSQSRSIHLALLVVFLMSSLETSESFFLNNCATFGCRILNLEKEVADLKRVVYLNGPPQQQYPPNSNQMNQPWSPNQGYPYTNGQNFGSQQNNQYNPNPNGNNRTNNPVNNEPPVMSLRRGGFPQYSENSIYDAPQYPNYQG